MFTGIIEEIGTVIKKHPSQDSIEWSIKTSEYFMQDIKIGDSISVAGVCQTVTRMTQNSFSFFSSAITVEITTLKNYVTHSLINLEKALQIGQRLGGHFVYGHIEGQAKVISIQNHTQTVSLTLEVPQKLQLLIVNKGSVTIDGVSLTVADYNFPHLILQIIPHTWTNTTLQSLKPGQAINIETDPLAKYVLQAMQAPLENPYTKLKKALIDNGYIK